MLISITKSFTYSQCTTACRSTVAVMETFCQLIQSPVIRASFRAVAPITQTIEAQMICINWCYWQFGPELHSCSIL